MMTTTGETATTERLRSPPRELTCGGFSASVFGRAEHLTQPYASPSIARASQNAGEGTDLVVEFEGLSRGVSAADNETGARMSLAKLAALVEGG
jgi:hypothetical protein